MKGQSYLIVIEKTKNNFAAYVPDLPGCVATARTLESLLKRMNTAIEWHLEAMQKSGSDWSAVARNTVKRNTNRNVAQIARKQT